MIQPFCQTFCLNGVSLIADPGGALWWPDRKLLAVADLHLEKGSGLAARGGSLLPPYDTTETLLRLEKLIARYRPDRLVAAGDSFHDRRASERLFPSDRHRLQTLTAACDWLWLTGNHDPDPDPALGGAIGQEFRIGPLVFRHEAQPGHHPGEISGHYHPKASLKVRGRRFSGPCFAEDGQRLILPAFGAYTGGLPVRDPVLSKLFSPVYRVHIMIRDRLITLPSDRLSD